MAAKIGNTKQHDSVMIWNLNGAITESAILKAWVRDVTTPEVPATEVPCSYFSARQVAITTSGLALGKYQLEVQVTIGGIKATYPDTGFATFNVNEDLGE